MVGRLDGGRLGTPIVHRADLARASVEELETLRQKVKQERRWTLTYHDDGHRHFYPLSDWRFESPVSYWDPAHYGQVAALFEALLVVAGSVVLYRRFDRPAVRGLVAVLGGVYVLYWIYVFVVWV